jgi:hypothetical protein
MTYTKIQEAKNIIEDFNLEGYEVPDTDFYYCWDSTKYGIDNLEEKGIKKVKAGYSPKNLKDLIFLPIVSESDYVSFRINPTVDNPFIEEQDVYIDVKVFKTNEEMQEFHKLVYNDNEDYPVDFGAITCIVPKTIIYSKEGGLCEKECSKIATILFAPTTDEGYVGGSVVTHESVHAAFATIRRLGVTLDIDDEDCNDAEELVAYLIQSINRSITDEFYNNKLW